MIAAIGPTAMIKLRVWIASTALCGAWSTTRRACSGLMQMCSVCAVCREHRLTCFFAGDSGAGKLVHAVDEEKVDVHEGEQGGSE